MQKKIILDRLSVEKRSKYEILWKGLGDDDDPDEIEIMRESVEEDRLEDAKKAKEATIHPDPPAKKIKQTVEDEPTLFTKDMRRELEESGFVVVTLPYTQKDRDRVLLFMQQWLDCMPLDFIESFPSSIGWHGIVKKYSGHSLFNWYMRLHPLTQQLFKELWVTDEICTSLDGFRFFASTQTRPKALTERWPHVDQGSKFVGLKSAACYQSLFTLDPAGNAEDDTLRPTTMFLLGAHKHHAAFAASQKAMTAVNFYKLTAQDEQFFIERGCKWVRATAPANSWIIWDSRLPHFNTTFGNDVPRNQQPVLYGRALFICFAPSERIAIEDVQKRDDAFRTVIETSDHWAGSACFKLESCPKAANNLPVPMAGLLSPAAAHEIGDKDVYDIYSRIGWKAHDAHPTPAKKVTADQVYAFLESCRAEKVTNKKDE